MGNVSRSEVTAFGELSKGLQGSLGVSGLPANSIGTTQIKNNSIGSQQLTNAGVPEYKLKDHYERGTITGVTLGGRYKVFATPFSVAPQVVVTGIGTAVTLALPPVTGSFKIMRVVAGTTNATFLAWGAR